MFSRAVALRFYYFAAFAAFGVYLPFFPRWLEARGIHGLAMSGISILHPAIGTFGPPLFGIAADAFGLRGSLLRVACIGAALSFGAVALVGASGASLGYPALFAIVAVYALFRSPMVMMGDVIALEEVRATGVSYGWIRLWGSVGFLAAALVAGEFIDPERFVVFPAAIAVALVASFLASLALPAKAPAPRRPVLGEAQALLCRKDFRLFLAVAFFSQAAHASYDLCASLYLRDRGGSGRLVGSAWALGVVVEVAVMTFSARLFSRFRTEHLLAAGILGGAVRWAAMALAPSLGFLVALQPLHGLSFGVVWLASLAFLKERAPVEVAATAQGLFIASIGVASVVGMLAWGPLYRARGGPSVFAAASLVAACGFVLALVMARQRPPRV